MVENNSTKDEDDNAVAIVLNALATAIECAVGKSAYQLVMLLRKRSPRPIKMA
ncbi:MAG: hypothetical protein ACI8Y7_000781 [Candidatus Woesearchaeota archaeon]|jgi:hypothetical protein